jgi:hypothetical protein
VDIGCIFVVALYLLDVFFNGIPVIVFCTIVSGNFRRASLPSTGSNCVQLDSEI